MARNQKLTRVIKGRTIQEVQPQDSVLAVTFTDGSHMTIKTGRPAAGQVVSKSPVKAVRQQDTTFILDFEDGSALEVQTAEATSSVMLRDRNRVLEYAD